MDLDKVSKALSAMNNALGSLEKAIELRQQTQRFRNVLTTNDLDKVTAICVTSIKTLNKELIDELSDD